jgi:hypothetical protein
MGFAALNPSYGDQVDESEEADHMARVSPGGTVNRGNQ